MISPSQRTPERIEILGVGISAINMDMAIETIDRWIGNREHRQFVCCTDVHGVVRSQENRDFRQILTKAGLVTPDGMPLVWISRLRNYRHVGRVYGPDLMSKLCSISAARSYRHFLYGGAEEVPGKLADCLRRRYPGIEIVGTHSPPFRPPTPEEDEAVIQRINDSKADIVWVGIGSPKQEYWMAAHLGRLDAPVMIGVGAAFDFLSGVKKQAPRWIQRSGLEWLFRLLTEPQRLWRRYFKIVPLFSIYIILDAIGLRDRKEPADPAIS